MKRIIDTEQVNLIGPRIRAARVAAGLSQKQLSERLELLAVYTCRGSISRIEHGKRAVTDIEIDGIAKILQVSPNELFGWDEGKVPDEQVD
ncbi:MAG: helix-turn-helix domain-containing protein [Clostridiales bacterium]|nr:helix-turn-helix domain-containing protein [Clostridiales bacterium]